MKICEFTPKRFIATHVMLIVIFMGLGIWDFCDGELMTGALCFVVAIWQLLFLLGEQIRVCQDDLIEVQDRYIKALREELDRSYAAYDELVASIAENTAKPKNKAS